MSAMQQSLLLTGAGPGTPAPVAPFYLLNSVSTSYSASQASYTLTKPSHYAVGDILILLIETANQTIATPTGGGTWTQVTNSPQFTGTAAAAGGVRLGVYYQVLTAPLNTASVTIADSGDHQVASMFAYRAADTTNPIEVTAGSVKSTATGTTFTLPSVTTTTDKALILLCVGQDRDLTSTTNLSNWINANLLNLTQRQDYTTALGVGGGIALADGVKEVAGSTGTTNVTSAAATTAAFITLALKSNTSYFNTTKVTGAQGSSRTVTYNSTDAISGLTLNANGTITVVGDQVVDPVSWVNLPASGVGTGYWVFVQQQGAGTGSLTGTFNTWLQLNTDRSWQILCTGGTQSWSGVLTISIASDSAGTNLLSISRFTLIATSNSGPPP